MSVHSEAGNAEERRSFLGILSGLIAAGITAFIGFQAVVNVGGVIRMLPMTGITLPFVSHGGWSLLTSFFMLGVLMAISHRNNFVGVPRSLSAPATEH